ncbi:uncharacterized protein LOC141686751 [Apium graveolens]|uniref:uncharacterized protein LOC141686751 n=1 Tax=Apium graveolens TaxID=4045 RepID=UPI003D78EC47
MHGRLAVARSQKVICKDDFAVIDTPEFAIKTIIPLINNEHNHIVGYNKMWRGKKIAIEKVYDSWTTIYQALPIILAAIIKTNPRTIAQIDVVPHAEERGCPYGRYRGKLLIAMGVDLNNHPFSLCYGLVDEETYENWSWFLEHLRRHVCR